MTQAVSRNFDVEQGTDWKFEFFIRDSGGSPIDLIAESAQIRMRVKSDYTLGAITYLSLSSTGTPNSRIVIQPGAVTGKVQVNVTAADTIALTLSEEQTTYVYDIEADIAATGIQRLYKGEFNLFKELTTPDSDFI